jgi:hypothetical protein
MLLFRGAWASGFEENLFSILQNRRAGVGILYRAFLAEAVGIKAVERASGFSKGRSGICALPSSSGVA